MVAKIKSGKSLIGALNYNENKVKTGKAVLIEAAGFPKDIDMLSFDDKLFRLTDLAARNQRTKTNTVHLSLNFAPDEKLEKNKLISIANDYLAGIGFGDQPYLVYQHHDAGHPHLHILTTNIESDGSRISLHNIGKFKSEAARKAIETDHRLVRACTEHTLGEALGRSQMGAVRYGATDTKRAITNIVGRVTRDYKFTSLPEFNAILNSFNIAADRGSKESVMFKKNGLLYWILDEKGNKQGVPIKASSIYHKPTLKLLEDRFRLNEFLRKPFQGQLRAKIDQTLKRTISKEQFANELQRLGVQVVFRQNNEGRIYGLTYIDHVNKTVFKGSDLGKSYSATAVIESMSRRTDHPDLPNEDVSGKCFTLPPTTIDINSPHLLDDLLSPYNQDSPVPGQFNQRKKKKKRKKLNL